MLLLLLGSPYVYILLFDWGFLVQHDGLEVNLALNSVDPVACQPIDTKAGVFDKSRLFKYHMFYIKVNQFFKN